LARGKCYKNLFISYPSGALLRCSPPGLAAGLTRKHYTKLIKHAFNKHSNLLAAFVNYGRKSFITLAPAHTTEWVTQIGCILTRKY